MKQNINKHEFLLHTKYLAGPMGSDFINILLPIGTEFYIGESKFIVKYHEFTQELDKLPSVLERQVNEWNIEIVSYEIENTGDIYTQMWRQTMLDKLI